MPKGRLTSRKVMDLVKDILIAMWAVKAATKG